VNCASDVSLPSSRVASGCQLPHWFVLLSGGRSDGTGWDNYAGRANSDVATSSLVVSCRLRLSVVARIQSGAASVGGDLLGSCCRTDYRGGGRSFVVVIRINFRLGSAGSRRNARKAETEHHDRNVGKLPRGHVCSPCLVVCSSFFTMESGFDAGCLLDSPTRRF
jgi:hypothetical protein